ncbi:MAG: sulfate transporter [Mycobacterium sp.]|jgi:hypothetical protein|nr:sulfate transporter [Mycobacterium sp.]
MAGACVLDAHGFLNSATYLSLRDVIIKAALDEPRAVIVDVTRLVVPAPSAWAVFTSARWHITRWPDVPMALVCEHREGREAVARNGVSRYVPVYPTTWQAIGAMIKVHEHPQRRRIRAELPADVASVARSRELMSEWLTHWDRAELISIAKLVVTVFVENVLQHTDSAPTIRLENNDDLVTVAVQDASTTQATRREWSKRGGDEVSGLAIVAALCRHWGTAPTSTGKTVWAVIGPENHL